MHHYLHDKARNVLSIINGKVPLYSAMSMTLSFRNLVDLWYWPFFSYMRFFKLYFNHSNIGNASKMFCDIFEMQCRIFSLTYTIQKIYAFTCTLHVRLVFFLFMMILRNELKWIWPCYHKFIFLHDWYLRMKTLKCFENFLQFCKCIYVN